MDTITVTVEGPTESGKSALCQLINETLQAYTFKVTLSPELQQELSITSITSLYTKICALKGKTQVCVVEKNSPRTPDEQG
jgi:thymidylate kinase